MIHRIFAIRIFFIDRNTLCVDAEVLDHVGDLVRLACNASDAAGDVGDILAEDFRCVALGIDSDEITLHLVT
ncbi:hypothetical protein D3C80_1790310 [compost metagenome]